MALESHSVWSSFRSSIPCRSGSLGLAADYPEIRCFSLINFKLISLPQVLLGATAFSAFVAKEQL
jgi:hypothetical protein